MTIHILVKVAVVLWSLTLAGKMLIKFHVDDECAIRYALRGLNGLTLPEKVLFTVVGFSRILATVMTPVAVVAQLFFT